MLYFDTKRFAESTELKRNTENRYTANATVFSKNGEKSNIDIITLYKGVVCSPGMNADFVINAGIHRTSAINTITIC